MVLTERKNSTQEGYHIVKPCSSDAFALSQTIHRFQKLDKLKFIFCNVLGHFCSTFKLGEKTKYLPEILRKS